MCENKFYNVVMTLVPVINLKRVWSRETSQTPAEHNIKQWNNCKNEL